MSKDSKPKHVVEGKKPYGFAPLPKTFKARPPIWHDGAQSERLLSGELRCELKTITPMLVGWERASPKDQDDVFAIPSTPKGNQRVVRLGTASIEVPEDKPLLCPLRAPWPGEPVLIPGDSLKGMLRHELGALLGAPMERVQERVYSYRPNLSQQVTRERFLEPRLARVLETADRAGHRVPTKVDIYPCSDSANATYYPRKDGQSPPPDALPYRGGVSAGCDLPECLQPSDGPRPRIRQYVGLGGAKAEHVGVEVSSAVIDQYIKTFDHYVDQHDGHYSSRHPGVGRDAESRAEVRAMMEKTRKNVFQKGDAIWVEVAGKEVVSFGWHYYYRWRYQDTVCTTAPRRGKPGGRRAGLSPTSEETSTADKAPKALTLVRRLFGYVRDKDNPGTHLGSGQHEQLMGRVFINTAIEDISAPAADRRLPPTYLKELGQPRPSAVEHYLRQPHVIYDTRDHRSRGSDAAHLMTYGDAPDRDEPGELAGRKHYLNWQSNPTSGAGKEEKDSKHATVAVGASARHTIFRFTVRFRDLEAAELAAILLALCPQQFAKDIVGDGASKKAKGKLYCSRVGYARPLGWGNVDIKTDRLLLLAEDADSTPRLDDHDVQTWFREHRAELRDLLDDKLLETWLALHEKGHPLAGDYPRADDHRDRKGEIYDYHTALRREHTQLRRQRAR